VNLECLSESRVPGPETLLPSNSLPFVSVYPRHIREIRVRFALGVAVAFHFIRSPDDPIIRFFYL
jgi:hypothetical protein